MKFNVTTTNFLKGLKSACWIILSSQKLFHMNLHEYQAKELLKKYQVPVQEGIAVDTVMAAEEA